MSLYLRIIKSILFATILLTIDSSCKFPCLGGGRAFQYFFYIDKNSSGSTSASMEISYLQVNKKGDGNTITTEIVATPFFKEVTTVDRCYGTPDNFLEINNNTISAKAILFNMDFNLPDGGSVSCTFEPVSPYCNTCTLSRDSVLNYFKSKNYPCYMELSPNDKSKRVTSSDARNWNP